jgi:hypothetical protein
LIRRASPTSGALFASREIAAMYEYRFVRIELRTGFERMKPVEDYQDVIEREALDDWRFVQVFAPPLSGTGYASFYDLIFERLRAD